MKNAPPFSALSEQPRERLVRLGARALNTYELLAILFRTGTRECSVLRMSKNLLERYGSLKNLSRVTVEELTDPKTGMKGIGTAKAVTLLAALELGTRMKEESLHTENLRGILMRLNTRLRNEEREFIYGIFLDNSETPIGYDKVSYGGFDGASLDAPYLLRRAVRLGAASVVLLHNHPNGTPRASNDDIRLSHAVAKRLSVLDIAFYGHYIVAGDRTIRIPGDHGSGRDVMEPETAAEI